MRTLAIALAFALAACAVPPTAPTTAAPLPSSAVVQQTAAAQADPGDPNVDAEACRARGGDIRPICMLQRPACVIRYADAGRECRGDADCEGRCYAKGGAASGEPAVGRCQATSNPCGCNTLVEDGRAGPSLCVD